MTDLRSALADYLAIRRSMGFTLERAGRLLPQFITYLESSGADTITNTAAAEWAMLPASATTGWQAGRLAMVRGFARYLHAIDNTHEIPPIDLIPGRKLRTPPYLYSEADIQALMSVAARLTPAWRASCYQTLVGVLDTTGLRLGEALALDRDDVDLHDGWITVRHAKRGDTRQVALHPTTCEALGRYCRVRDQQCPAPTATAFFISMRGQRLGSNTVHDNFRLLVDRAGLHGRGARGRPRPHDLRHNFSVRTVLNWYRDGVDVDAHMALLTTWLGHAEPASTYWYLQASPELLAAAADRLQACFGERRR